MIPTSPAPRLLLAGALAFAVLTGVGCAAKSKEAISTPVAENARPAPVVAKLPPAPVAPASDMDEAPVNFGPIYYALDSAQLLPESTQTLQRLADYLRKNPGKQVTVEGHTCELGTSEYNVALGQKRAYAARSYLVSLGVNPKQVDTVSYGQERPASHGEAEHQRSQNRRSEFSLKISDGRQAGR